MLLHHLGTRRNDLGQAILAGEPQRGEEGAHLGWESTVRVREVLECETNVIQRELGGADHELLDEHGERRR